MEEKGFVPAMWKKLAIAAMIVALAALVGVATLMNKQPASSASETVSAEEALSYWTDESELKQQLVAYVESVTDPNSPDFIPVVNRVAVFDFDGTLFCETDPNYFDYTLLVHRVLEDENYQPTEFERQTAEKIVEQNKTGAKFEGLEVDHGRCIASAFSGMTFEEFDAYVQEFKKLAMPSYDGMERGNGWYLPMIQVVRYLEANDFDVYIISGTDRFIVRSIVNGSEYMDIFPQNKIIGSDEAIVASNENGEDGLTYQFQSDDKLVLGGEFMVKNLKMNKVKVIAQEIGFHPVLSFGNTMGDASMADYTITDNQYKSKAFMLCCDDLERENGNIKKADDMYAECESHGWIPVSMKNDWTTIYGDEVTYKNPKKEGE